MLHDQVLRILCRDKGQLVTGGDISRELSVSRTAVWKAIAALRQDGHVIESVSNRGYRLMQDSDGLALPDIRELLSTGCFGRNMEILQSTTSTNQYMKQLDISALGEGYTVISNEQTSGRGRLGRAFYSPAHEGLYMSVLLKPPIPLQESSMLTICAAVAACRGLEEACDITPGIKWVNDLYWDGKKLCGILTEASVAAELQTMEFAIVGIGINTGKVPREVSRLATSVMEINGRRGIRNALAASVLNHFEDLYLGYVQTRDKAPILREYDDRLFITGRAVTVSEGDATFPAVVRGIDDSGHLLVLLEDGGLHTLRSGEIQL